MPRRALAWGCGGALVLCALAYVAYALLSLEPHPLAALAFAASCVAIGAAYAALLRRRERAVMRALEDAVDDAMIGMGAPERAPDAGAVAPTAERPPAPDRRDHSFEETAASALMDKLGRLLDMAREAERRSQCERDAVQSLVSDISHQTKTPLSNLLLYAQLLCESELPEAPAQLARRVAEQADKLSFLVTELVRMSRLEAGLVRVRPARTALRPLLERCVRSLAPAADARGISLCLRCDEAHTARCDARWTSEAIANLLDNAVKYTPPGGHVAIDVRAYDAFVRIDVSDDGPGVPPDDIARLFGRFARGGNAGGVPGLGIGLYLAREIVRAQHGYMRVRSTPGAGSAFSVYLRA